MPGQVEEVLKVCTWERVFSVVMMPGLWNVLPQEIRQATTHPAFRWHLATVLLSMFLTDERLPPSIFKIVIHLPRNNLYCVFFKLPFSVIVILYLFMVLLFVRHPECVVPDGQCCREG